MSAKATGGATPLARTWDNVGKHSFVPEHYEFSDQNELMAYIKGNPVAQIFANHKGEMHLTSAPFIHAPNEGNDTRLAGHIAGRNAYGDAIKAGVEAVAQFISPGAYISPRWFQENITAPTFSYVSVQARGRFVPISDADETLLILAKTVDHMEALTSAHDGADPWCMTALTAEQMARYIPMVQAFYFEVTALEGIARLNQEKTKADMEGIIEGLSGQENAGAQHIAGLMHANLKRVAD